VVVVTWLDVLLGAVCAGIAGVHLVLLATRRAPVAGAVAHAVMGLGMAAMFVPTADVVPRPVWIGAFALIAAWFGVEAVRAGTLGGAHGQHVVGAAAMLFMLLAGHHAGGVHAHHVVGAEDAGAGLLVTAAALALAAWFVADVVRELSGPGRAASGGRRIAVAAQTVMGATMAMMLLAMA